MRSRLANKFLATIIGVVALALLSSVVTLWAAWRISIRLDEASRENQWTLGGENVKSLLSQGNFLLASYLLDTRNPIWEKKFRDIQPQFQAWITTVRNTIPLSDQEKEVLPDLEKAWAALDTQRDEVIALCKKGETDRARTLFLTEVDGRLSTEALTQCNRWIEAQEASIRFFMTRAGIRVGTTSWVVGISSLLTLLLGGLLLWLFYYRVLVPLQGMVADVQLYRGTPQANGVTGQEDELRMIGDHLRNLMSDVSDTRSRLERSRNQLLVAEKLASVGKLAASVAHEIRNPLTAMKMWVFSIEEAVAGNANVVRKLAIISEEIARLESIVRNFLEFSRPPVLHCQPLDVASVVDQTLEFLGPRFQGEKITITRSSGSQLPPVMADAAQLKQVLLNILCNAADAMAGGGNVQISSSAEKDAEGRPMVVVRVGDTGPGMPPDVQRRIFEPFFTTKENGTGLGLCIAAQVMVRHGGGLVLESSSEKGTVFALWIPIAVEEAHAENPPR
jgi:signal transduction histidine kinase